MTAIFDSFLNFDLSVFQWVQGIQNEVLNMFFKIYTTLGEAGILFIAIALPLMLTKKYRKVGFAMMVSLVVMVIGNNLILKSIFARPRPFNLDPDAYAWWFKSYVFPEIVSRPSSYSFPSGHTSSAFAAAFAAMAYNRKWGSLVMVLAVLMGFSRIYVEVHYPSDVIAGFFVGIIYALIGMLLVKLFFPLYEKILDALLAKLPSKKKAE